MTQMCVSIPHRITDSTPRADKCCVTSGVHILNCVLAKTAVGVGGRPEEEEEEVEEEEVDVAVDASASFQMVDNSCTVCFMALGYCSVTTTGTLSAVAEASRNSEVLIREAMPWMMGRNTSWMSQMSKAVECIFGTVNLEILVRLVIVAWNGSMFWALCDVHREGIRMRYAIVLVSDILI